METLTKLSRLIHEAQMAKEEECMAVLKEISFLISSTQWTNVMRTSKFSSADPSLQKELNISLEEWNDLKNASIDNAESLTVYRRFMVKKINVVIKLLEEKPAAQYFEEIILPLLVSSTGFPLKFLEEGDHGKDIPFATVDVFGKNEGKTHLLAPFTYQSYSNLPSNPKVDKISRLLLIPLIQHVITSSHYISLDHLEHSLYIMQCLRLAVHYEDPNLHQLNQCFWHLPVQVIRAADMAKTPPCAVFFNQLYACVFFDNGTECTEAVWQNCPAASVGKNIIPREEFFAYLALFLSIKRRINVNGRVKTCMRQCLKSMMRSVIHRNSSEDMDLLIRMLRHWVKVGDNSPIDIDDRRLMIKNTVVEYEHFLKATLDPQITTGLITMNVFLIAEDCVSINNYQTIIKNAVQSILEKVKGAFGRMQKNKKTDDPFAAFLRFGFNALTHLEESDISDEIGKDKPSALLFRCHLLDRLCEVADWKMSKSTSMDDIETMFKKITKMIKGVTNAIGENTRASSLNESVVTLCKVALHTIKNSSMPASISSRWLYSLMDSRMPHSLVRLSPLCGIEEMKKKCIEDTVKVISTIGSSLKGHCNDISIAHFDSFFIDAFSTEDLPEEIRDEICSLWKDTYGQLEKLMMTEGLMAKLEWFNLPIPGYKNGIRRSMEVEKVMIGSPQKSPPKKICTISNTSSIISSIQKEIEEKKKALMKKPHKSFSLIDEDSVSFVEGNDNDKNKPVKIDNPKLKQHMTDRQKEMLLKRDDIIEDESISNLKKNPLDMFEMSNSCMDVTSSMVTSSKSDTKKPLAMMTDFSGLLPPTPATTSTTSDGKEDKKSYSSERVDDESSLEVPSIDSFTTESADDEDIVGTSSISTTVEIDRSDRRKGRTPVKFTMTTRNSPSRSKRPTASAPSSVAKSSKKVIAGTVAEVRTPTTKSGQTPDMDLATTPKKSATRPKRSSAIFIRSPVLVNIKGTVEEEGDDDDAPLRTLSIDSSPEKSIVPIKNTITTKRDKVASKSMDMVPAPEVTVVSSVDTVDCEEATPSCSSSSSTTSTPQKNMISPEKTSTSPNSVPSTPLNRGQIEPVGILSSSKKNKEKRRPSCGVHFNIVEKEPIDMMDNVIIEEDNIEDMEDKEKLNEDDESETVYPLLASCTDSIDGLLLKFGNNAKMVKTAFERKNVTTIGELAVLNTRELNGMMGIRPPKIQTIQSALEAYYTKKMSTSSSKTSMTTPENKTIVPSDNGNTIGSSSPPSKSPKSIPSGTPPKAKFRKRIDLSDCAIGAKKAKENIDTKEIGRDTVPIDEYDVGKKMNEDTVLDKSTVDVVDTVDSKDEDNEKVKNDVEESGLIYPSLSTCTDSLDGLLLKFGSNTKMVKAAFDRKNVKTVGQLASLDINDLNCMIGIRPPKVKTVKSVLDNVYAKMMGASASKFATPDKKKSATVSKSEHTVVLSSQSNQSPSVRRATTPKTKFRKRLNMSDAPIVVKKIKEDGESEEKMVTVLHNTMVTDKDTIVVIDGDTVVSGEDTVTTNVRDDVQKNEENVTMETEYRKKLEDLKRYTSDYIDDLDNFPNPMEKIHETIAILTEMCDVVVKKKKVLEERAASSI